MALQIHGGGGHDVTVGFLDNDVLGQPASLILCATGFLQRMEELMAHEGVVITREFLPCVGRDICDIFNDTGGKCCVTVWHGVSLAGR